MQGNIPSFLWSGKKKRAVSCSPKYLIKEETFKYGLDHFTVYLPLCLLIADMVGNIICPCIACCMLSCWGIRSCYIHILCFVFLWNISWIRFSFTVWCVRIMFSASYFIYQFLARWSKCEIWLWLVPSTSFTCAMFSYCFLFSPIFDVYPWKVGHSNFGAPGCSQC